MTEAFTRLNTLNGDGPEPTRDDDPGPPIAVITIFEKSGGPLTKHIELVDGKVSNDSSLCAMGSGDARRVRINLNAIAALAKLINGLGPSEAYALGRLREGSPDRVKVVVADKLADFHGDRGVAARTKEYFTFTEGAAAVCLLDIDLKGVNEDAKRRIREPGVWASLCAVVPPLANAARVTRESTSHGLRNTVTGEIYRGSGGFHAAIAVADGADIPRFLADFHDRLWLVGLGWGMVSAAGSFLERALIDRAVGSPERLIFEAPPVIVPPLEQAPRLAEAFEGAILDTRVACPPLTAAEQAEAQNLKEAEKLRLKPEREEARAKWSDGHIKRLVASGMPEARARAQVARWLDQHELSGEFPLPFDDPKLAGTTVGDVLDNPDKFIDATLADPFEGPAYGRGKARIYRRSDGSLFINSFAHGGFQYKLKAAPKPRPAKFRLIPFEDIKFFATEEWRIKKLLPRQGVAPIFGASKGLKSFVCVDIALHVALGWDWAGRRTKQGPVVYIAAENSAGIRKRKAGFEMAHAERLPDRVPFYLIDAAPNLGTERNDREALIASVEAIGVTPALIFIDTLAQTLGGGEENSTGMVTFLSNATALANHFKCCVVPVHHVPHGDEKRMRGHSSLPAGVDALIRAERKGVEPVTTLTLDKLRDEEDGAVLTVRLERIVIGHDEDSDEISTLVVAGVEDGAPVQAVKGKAPRTIPRSRRLLMEMVELAIDEAGQDFRSFADGPTVRAAPEEAVRLRYYIRIAEQAALDEAPAKLAARQRQAFNRAVKAALDAKDVIARKEEDKRFLWLPS